MTGAQIDLKGGVARMKVGSKFKLTGDAIENYGQKYKDEVFTVSKIYTSKREHPGFDSSAGSYLYGSEFSFDLYSWEMIEE